MKFLNTLERKLPFLAAKNLIMVLIGGQVFFFFLYKTEMVSLNRIVLVGAALEAGQYWRLFSFLFVPTQDGIFIIFFWYLFYLYGSALEQNWGSFKFNLYILTGYVLSISAAFIFPFQPITNYYFYLSVFFAFAWLFPNFELYIFFILPVKIKWLALIMAAYYLYNAIMGGWFDRVLILLSVGNFFIFFSKDIYLMIRYGNRKMVYKVKQKMVPTVIHTCTSCGVRDIDDFEIEFRYRNEDNNSVCYCIDCLKKIKSKNLTE